jgi:hypothetical protein
LAGWLEEAGSLIEVAVHGQGKKSGLIWLNFV